MKLIRDITRVFSVLRDLRRWQLGFTPRFSTIRLVIEYLEQTNDPGSRLLFGEQLHTAVMDRARRRRMAVWHVRQSMTTLEKWELAMQRLNAVCRRWQREL